MKKNKAIYHLLTAIIMMFFCNAKIIKGEEINYYDGELGSFYSQNQTTFKLWSSSANSVKVVIEGANSERCPDGVCTLVKEDNVWVGYAPGNLLGKEYSFTIEDSLGNIYENVLDPYGKYFNASKSKNVIYDDNSLTFDEWNNQVEQIKIKDMYKSIYAVDVVNFTKHSSWSGTEVNRGKLLALSETGTKYNGILTGFDHINDLGITYLELSEIYDSDNPFVVKKEIVSGTEDYSGVIELKKVINTYYSKNIGVILTFDYETLSEKFLNNLNTIDASAYLNSEGRFDVTKTMSQKYIKDILLMYVKQYKVSGIKIKNMADYSIDFMNQISELLITEDNQLLIYGDGGYETLNENNAGENNLSKLNNISMMNGSLNYGLFGNLLDKETKGILDGNYSENIIESLKFSLLSSVNNGQINYSLVEGISYKQDWGNETSYQLINYLGLENGLSLFDKLAIENLTGQNLIKQKMVLAFSTMMISGGIPYINAGNEFLVSYLDTTDSGNSICDETNTFCFHKDKEYKIIDWSYAKNNEETISAFKSLLNYRKSANTVAQVNSKIIKNTVQVYTNEDCKGLVGFTRNYPNAYAREVEKIFVVINYSNNDYVLENMGDKGWYGLYKYNHSSRDGNKLNLKANSFYSELKEKQPKVSPVITLIIVVGIIGGLYTFNIVLNKKLVEKRGYDIQSINKKYRPFINKNKLKDKNEQEGIVNQEVENNNQDENENQ